MMQPSGTDLEVFPRMIPYRRAYGLAADLVEQAGKTWRAWGWPGTG
jgi:hypothetical protein